MTERDTLTMLLDQLEQRRGQLDRYTKHWHGQSPNAYLSTKSRDALDQRLARLGVNFPRLVVRSMTDRLRVTGFRVDQQSEADDELWRLYRRAGLVAGSELVHADRSLYGAAFVTVWGHERDPYRPVARLDDPLHVAVDRDPATGEVLSAVRRWNSREASHAVVYDAEAARVWRAGGKDMPAGAGAWELQATVPHPLGVCPVVPFVRQSSGSDLEGTSAVADVLDLTDAVAKVLQDAMVTSEYYARPKRWATGLELQYDDDGNVLDPFGEGRFLQSESEQTRFGQLDPVRLDGYSDLLASLTQQVGALTGLPPHYLGLHGDQPANADSVRAAEAQLTSAAFSEQRQLDPSWSLVAALLQAVATGDDPLALDITPVWGSPEIRTPGQAADAAVKLDGIGVPLRSLLIDTLGYEPDQADRIMADRRADQVQRAGLDVRRLLPTAAAQS
jgi:Phage portal protein, SPP1 Gp6-like